MIPIFYTDPENIIEEALYIDGAEGKHLRDVMRRQKGELIIVVDGLGNAYKCEIEKISKDKINCTVITKTRQFGEPLHFVTLAAGLSTGYKFDEVIMRATELGVSRFLPLITEKSKIKIDDEKREKNKLARWQKVAVASMKQTRRSFLPEISPITNFDNMLKNLEESHTTILFDPTYADKNLQNIKVENENKKINIIIGPESGFSKEEINLAREHDCQIVKIGPRILRTENASPVAIALIMNMLSELR
ncbi:MAG: RsmE family RNA methyltransferase [Candidatus Zixiibacteriota bacterium]